MEVSFFFFSKEHFARFVASSRLGETQTQRRRLSFSSLVALFSSSFSLSLSFLFFFPHRQ